MFTIIRFTETARRQSVASVDSVQDCVLKTNSTNVDHFKTGQTPALVWQVNLVASVPKSKALSANSCKIKQWKIQRKYICNLAAERIKEIM